MSAGWTGVGGCGRPLTLSSGLEGPWMGCWWAWGSKRTPSALLGSGGSWVEVVDGRGWSIGGSNPAPRAHLGSRGAWMGCGWAWMGCRWAWMGCRWAWMGCRWAWMGCLGSIRPLALTWAAEGGRWV